MKSFIRPARTLALSATSFVISTIACLTLISALAVYAGKPVNNATAATSRVKTDKKSMRAFASEDELKNYFRQLAEERKRQVAHARATPGMTRCSYPKTRSSSSVTAINAAALKSDSSILIASATLVIDRHIIFGPMIIIRRATTRAD